PAAPEVAERARRVPRARPMRRLAVAQLERQSPVVRLHPPEAGQDAVETGELDGHRLGERLGRDERRLEQLTAEREQVGERAAVAGSRRAAERSPEAERLGDRLREVVGE